MRSQIVLAGLNRASWRVLVCMNGCYILADCGYCLVQMHRVDLGSADELAIDILLNSLMQLSKEYVGIKKIFVGGINEDWKEDTLGRGGGDLAFRLGQPRAGPRSADF